MAERQIKDILMELFSDSDAALVKYAKVRHVQYEMELWYKHHCDIDKGVKAYFVLRFLNGKRISDCGRGEIREALDKLDHAVKDGCHGRCVRLITELNKAFEEKDIEQLQNIEAFLDFVTFDYETRRDEYTNELVCEPGYGFEIRVFHDTENRSAVWKKIKSLLDKGKMMPISRVCQILGIERKFSKKII